MADMFLMLEGIKGESLDQAKPIKHLDEIEIMNWSWLVKNPAKWQMGQQEAASKADVDPIRIEKGYDRASVTLMQYCAMGKHIRSGKITCRKNAGGTKIDYLIIKLQEVMIKSVEWKGGHDPSPETVVLSFSKFEVEYTLQPQPPENQSGTPQAQPSGPETTQFGFDINTHTAIAL